MFKVENKFKGANNQVSIRFTEEMQNALKKIAEKNEVSFNNIVLQCCQYALDNIENNELDDN